LTVPNSQTEPKKKSRRFYMLLVSAVLLVAVMVGIVIFRMPGIGQPSYDPGPVDIEVVADKSFYLQGEEVNFTVYVSNPQDWSVPEPSGVIYEMYRNSAFIFGGDKHIDFVPDKIPVFAAHSRILFETWSWDGKVGSGDNRTVAPPGNYMFTVRFGGLIDYGNSGNCTFEIRLGIAS
jgi:hypothetical protein